MCLCVSVCICVQVPTEARVLGASGAGVTSGYEPPNMDAVN